MLKGKVKLGSKEYYAIKMDDGSVWRSHRGVNSYNGKHKYAHLYKAGASVARTFKEVDPAGFVAQTDSLAASGLRLVVDRLVIPSSSRRVS